jgi:hypothetical protein
MINKLFVFLSLLFIIACAGQKVLAQNDRPAWIDRPGGNYPQSDFITAVGSADNLNDAENAALGNLAKVFSVQIKVDETLINRYVEKGGDVTGSALLIGKTDTKTIQKLKNIQIARTYYSESEGLHYALAVLDRKETARIYRHEIQDNNLKIKDDLEKYQLQPHSLERLKYISRAVQTAAVNDALSERYKIITGGNTISMPYTLRELADLQAQERGEITVSVFPETSADNDIETYLKSVINIIGLKISEQPSDLSMRYRFESKPMQINRPNMYALKWNITIFITSNMPDKGKHTFTYGKRTVSINRDQAEMRMKRAVQKWINTKFKQDLQKLFNF